MRLPVTITDRSYAKHMNTHSRVQGNLWQERKCQRCLTRREYRVKVSLERLCYFKQVRRNAITTLISFRQEFVGIEGICGSETVKSRRVAYYLFYQQQ